MSLAAFGCNPEDTGASLDDVGGHQPGTLAYSPDGGIYVVVQASEAVAAHDTCLIQGNWRVRPLDTADDKDLAVQVCIPQVALANGAYGWGLVFGNGRARASADIAANVTGPLYPTPDEGKLLGTVDGTNALHLTGVYKTEATLTDESEDPIFAVAVTWPHIDLVI